MLLLLLLESNQNKPGKLISVLCCVKSLLHHFLETEQTLMKDREGMTETCHLKLKNIKISNKNRSFLSPGKGGR